MNIDFSREESSGFEHLQNAATYIGRFARMANEADFHLAATIAEQELLMQARPNMLGVLKGELRQQLTDENPDPAALILVGWYIAHAFNKDREVTALISPDQLERFPLQVRILFDVVYSGTQQEASYVDIESFESKGARFMLSKLHSVKVTPEIEETAALICSRFEGELLYDPRAVERHMTGGFGTSDVHFIARDLDHDRIVGVVGIGDYSHYDGFYAQIFNIAVLEQCTGQGVARKLVDNAQEYARRIGYRYLAGDYKTSDGWASRVQARLEGKGKLLTAHTTWGDFSPFGCASMRIEQEL